MCDVSNMSVLLFFLQRETQTKKKTKKLIKNMNNKSDHGGHDTVMRGPPTLGLEKKLIKYGVIREIP